MEIIRVAFHTLGCKVNQYETEAMKEAFVSRGAVIVGEEDPADAYIINTCTVTNIADRKSRQYIRRVKRVNPAAIVVVTGCYAQVEPEEVSAMPEVDLVIGNGRKSRICDMVYERLDDGRLHRANDDVSADVLPEITDTGGTIPNRDGENESQGKNANVMVLPRNELTEYEDMGMVTSAESGKTRAYIKIQEGCDRFCAYCLIPYARGPVRSRPPEDVVREAAMLVDSGVREIVLTGINTALYGTEPGFAWSLTDNDGKVLPGLEEIAAMTESERAGIAPIEIILARLDALDFSDFRIRLSSLEPTVVDKNHALKIIRYRRLCHHLHLSVQNGSDRILRSMNRHYTRDEYLDIVKAIREYDPLYGITTDIIVGFPGETDEDFEDTLDVVRKAEFGKVHAFRYSPRKGTAGARMGDAIPGQIKNDRAEALEQEAARTAQDFMTANLGSVHTVLAEEYSDGYLTGYTGNYIRVYLGPDAITPGHGIGHEVEKNEANCGGQCEAGDNLSNRPGEFYRVRLTELFRDGCLGELI